MNERRKQQLKMEGLDIAKVEKTVKALVDRMLQDDMTIAEGLQVINEMDCIRKSALERNPDTKLKIILIQNH